jgi:predicted DNA-binding transcriptional regulator AlpA
MREELNLLGIEELAAVLHRSPKTIRSDVTRRPETLPPRVRVPGGRKVLWRAQDVAAWLERNVER